MMSRARFIRVRCAAAVMLATLGGLFNTASAQGGDPDRPWLNEGGADQPWVGGAPPSYRGEPAPYPGEPPPPPRGYRDYPEPPAGGAGRMGWQGDVLFDLGSARLKSQYEPFLDSIYQRLRADPDVDLLVTGHADNIGDLDYNRELGHRRAEAVAGYLADRGIEPQRIVTRTVGEQRPVASSRSEEDRRRNRRADLAFFPAGNEPPPRGDYPIGDTEPGRGPPPGPSYRRLPAD